MQRDTNPSLWGYGNVDLASLQADQAARAPESGAVTLERWCKQIVQDRTPDHLTLQRFAAEWDEMTALYLEMRDMGRSIRRRVGTKLNEEHYPKNHPTVRRPIFDPDRSGPYSQPKMMNALCRLYNIELVRMAEHHKIVAAQYSGSSHMPVYAYMQTFGTMRAPLIAVDIQPYGNDDNDPNLWMLNSAQWTFAAACCLAKYFKDHGMYVGAGAPMDIIAPFDPQDHAGIMPLTHVFAKALLYFTWRCPDSWPCTCNTIEDMFEQVPESHPWQTGALPSNVVRSTSPGGYGAPSAPSRTMTPPGGVSTGDLMRQWHRDHS